MPRIRTLKPDHRLHRKVGSLDDTSYRLWVGMVLEADDEGRLVAEAHQLKALIFGLRPQTRPSVVDRALSALHSSGLIRLYTVNGTQYAWFPSWKDHQRISHPSPSGLPACPDELERMVKVLQKVPEDSRAFTEDSTGKGKEGKGKEGRERKGTEPPPDEFLAAIGKLRERLGPSAR